MTPNHPKTSPPSFASDVLKLVGGTTFAQALAILAAPVLTRIYAPEAFGVAALFTAITGIVAVVAGLRYELAIMLPEKDGDAANVLGLSLLIAAGMSAFLGLVVWLGQEWLVRLLNAPELAPYLWLAPIAVFLSGTFLALNYWNSRTKRFGRLSIARINASISTTGCQIGAGIAGYPTGGSLIFAGILGSAVSTFVLGGQIWRDDRGLIRNSMHAENMMLVMTRYRKFPLIDAVSALLNTISWQLPVFLLSAFFSTTIVGLYALCYRVLSIPMNFIGSSISQVFFQRAALAKADGSLSYVVEDVFKVLVILSLFPMMTVTLIGKDLFIILFGSSWSEAGVYAQILGIYTFLWFISSPLSTIYIVLEKQELGLKLNIANIIARFFAIGIGGLLGNPRISILLFAVFGMLIYSYLLLIILKFSGVSVAKAIKIISFSLGIFAPAGIIILALKSLSVDHLIPVGASAFLVAIYYLMIAKIDPTIRNAFYQSKDLLRLSNRLKTRK